MNCHETQHECCRNASKCGGTATLRVSAIGGLVGLLVILGAGAVRAEYRETFESSSATLRLADADCTAELLAQQRVFERAHSGQGCEEVVVRAGRGTRVYLDQPIAPAQVIDELAIRVWLRSDRPGVQLLARVVLPRAVDRRTGKPLTMLVWGGSYREVGVWQAVALTELPKRVQRQARVVSSERGEPVDVRQAYVDKVVINAYGGPGVTRLWVDDLEIDGHAAPLWWKPGDSEQPFDSPKSDVVRASATAPVAAEPVKSKPTNGLRSSLPAPTARLQGSVLVVDDRPFFARAVAGDGESLDWLKSLGFNLVVLSSPPTVEQSASAERLNLWLVAPRPARSPAEGRSDRVLARLVFPSDSSAAGSLADGADGPDDDGEPAERLVDDRLTVALHEPRDARNGSSVRAAGGDLLLTPYAPPWVRRKPVLESSATGGDAARSGEQETIGRPDQPGWALIDVEQVVRDAAKGDRGDRSVEGRRAALVDALRRHAWGAVLRGARGWCLTAALPESAPASDVPVWTDAVQLVQREIELASPWLSAGAGPDRLAAPGPDWRVAAFDARRSRLLVVLDESPPDPARRLRTTPPSPSGGRIAFTSATSPIVPPLELVDGGAPTSTDAYLIGPTSIRPLDRRRVAGGVAVSVERPETTAMVVFTQDALVVGYLARQSSRPSP